MHEESMTIQPTGKKASLLAGALFSLSSIVILGVVSVFLESAFLVLFIWAIVPAIFMASSTMWWFIVEKKGRHTLKYGLLAGLLASLLTYLLVGILWNLGFMLFTLVTDGDVDALAGWANPLSMLGVSMMSFLMSFPLIPIPMAMGGFLAHRRGKTISQALIIKKSRMERVNDQLDGK
ncbi:MAG: hypothetical protein HQL72_00565 [Magnetococcales bacterium]|nr:hypothetical protein [Magnetococcales bacterium]